MSSVVYLKSPAVIGTDIDKSILNKINYNQGYNIRYINEVKCASFTGYITRGL